MIIRKLRLQRGWSQAQLAEMTGVTTRTIQRLEQGQKPSLETHKALAAVFEVNLPLVEPEEDTMDSSTELKADEKYALLYAKRVKAFYEYLATYTLLALVFIVLYYNEPMVYVVFAGLGVGLIIQGLIAFEVIGFMSTGWEKRLAERKLGRKL